MSDYTDKVCPIMFSSRWNVTHCVGEQCAWFSKCYTPTIEVSEDCISRLQVLELLNAMTAVDSANAKVYAKVFSQIKDAPSVVPKQKEGEWELASDNDGEYGICSLCGNDADFTHYGKPYNYCPNCGARMEIDNEK